MGENMNVPLVNGNPAAQTCPPEILQEQNTLKAITNNNDDFYKARKPTVEIYLSELENWQHQCQVPMLTREAWVSLHDVFATLEIYTGRKARFARKTTFSFGQPAQKIFSCLQIHEGTLPRKEVVQW